MEKMNQVSVSEFMNLTKEEMYDNAVKMVEKYNRLADICNDSAERIAILVKENERKITYADELNKDIAKKAVKIKLLEQEIEGRKEGYWALKEKYDKLEKEFEAYKEEHEGINAPINDAKYWKEAFETQATSLSEVRKCNDNLIDTLNKSSDRVEELEEENKRLTKELNESYKAWDLDSKNLQKREMTLVDEIAKKNREIDHWKNQLRAKERKVDELWKENEKLKGANDHGRAGFKEYIKWIVKEEEKKFEESWKARLNKELETIFKEEEKTEVNDIPCGKDSIE